MHRGEVFLTRFGIRSGLGLGKGCNGTCCGGGGNSSGASREFTSPQRIFGAGEWSLEQLWCSSAVVTMGRPSFLSSLKHSSFFLPCKVGFALQSFSFCPSLWGIFVGVFWQPSTLVGILFASVYCNRISEMSAMWKFSVVMIFYMFSNGFFC